MVRYYLLTKVLASDLSSSYTSYQSWYLKCASGSSTFKEALTNCLSEIQKFLLYFVPAMAILSFVIAGVLFIAFSTNPDKLKLPKSIIFYTILGLAIAFGAEILLEIVKYIFG